MGLADAPDAQAQLAAFLERAQRERIPLSAFHFGSGYTSRGKRRYVFTWNRDKFPEPKALTGAFQAAGVRLVANLKPCLLDDHPAFAEVVGQGAMVSDAEGAPCIGAVLGRLGRAPRLHASGRRSRGGSAAFASRSSTTASTPPGTTTTSTRSGTRKDARTASERPCRSSRSRPLHGLLMTRASAEAQAARTPGSRVYTITRAGMPGCARYAQTWSGDNTTSWHTLRWNQRMGLSMGLSGMFNIGHDIGGFAGPTPDAELLVRWMQACALNPRCIMNSWKDDGSVNTPWLHSDATAPIRAAIELRLTLLPYLYSCLHESVGAHRPVLRPTFFEFPDDPRCWEDNDEFLVGAELLVGARARRRIRQRARCICRKRAIRPDGAASIPVRGIQSGQTIEVAAPIDRLPLFVRANAVLPTTDTTDFSRRTDEPSRALRLYPAPAGAPSWTSTPWVEDDGVSLAWQTGALTRITTTLSATAEAIQLNLRREGEYSLPCDRVRLVLPAGETRTLDWTSQALELFA